MRAIWYNPDDFNMVTQIGDFIVHVHECPDCREHAKTPEGRAALTRAVAMLDKISGEDLSVDDLQGALDFCTAWITAHNAVSFVDLLTVEYGEPSDGKPATYN